MHINCWKRIIQHVESTEFLLPGCEAKKHIVMTIRVSFSQTACSALWNGPDLNITFFLQNGWTFNSPVFSCGTLVSIHGNYTPWAPSAWIPTLTCTSTKQYCTLDALYFIAISQPTFYKIPGGNKSQELTAHPLCKLPQINCIPIVDSAP